MQHTLRLASLGKNSFTLLETIVALIIVSVLFGGFFDFLTTSNTPLYQDLQSAHNQFESTRTVPHFEGFQFVQ